MIIFLKTEYGIETSMPRSTARFIPYDLRPAKQAERRIMLDFLENAKEGGLYISDSRYVGMGGFKFHDFVMMHRHVGLREMISLEHDTKLAERALFNRPYDFIKVQHTRSSKNINQSGGNKKSIFWLDYDDSLNDDIVYDISLLGDKLVNNSLAFITVAADLPSDLMPLNEAERKASLVDQFGDFALSVTLEDVEDQSFSIATYKILLSLITNAFAARAPLQFTSGFRVLYRDTTNMLTIGGYLTDAATASMIAQKVKTNLPFLCRDTAKPYKIRNFNLSERERALIEFASSKKRASKEANQLRRLGIKNADIEAYRDLLRFVPRYFETLF